MAQSAGIMPPSTEQFRLGDVFGRAMSLFTGRFGPFLALTIIAYLPSYVLTVLLPRPGSPGAGPLGVIGILAGLICSSLASAALTYGVVQELRGRSFTISESLSIALRRFFPLVGVGISVSLLAGLAAILLIFPAFIVLCTYYVAGPACIVERLGVGQSMKRSAGLTKGYRWQIFGIVLLVMLVTMLVGSVLGIAIAPLGAAGPFIVGAWQVLSGTFGAVLVGVIYFRLRSVKEGLDIDQIASVFD